MDPSRTRGYPPRTIRLFSMSLIATLALSGAAALQAQPLIEWRFDDRTAFAAGTVANARSSSYAGTLFGTRSQVSAVLGNGVDFDGSTGYMSAAGTTGLSFGTGITVEAFIRRDTNTGEDGIVSKWYGADQFMLAMYPTGNGRLVFAVRGSGGLVGSIAYNVPDLTYLGEWVHVAGTYDGAGNFRLYWNGTQVASSLVSISGMAAGSLPIHVGDSGPTWSRFDGAIDEVKIWTRARTASEISRPMRPRVLVIEYDSADPTYNNPHTITDSLINNVSNASQWVRHEYTWVNTGIMPPQRAGGGFNYASMFSTYDICGKAKRGDVHEVWVWAGPDGGLAEWAVTGPYREAYGLGVGMPFCDIQLVTMGFNYQRQLPEASESFAHRLEFAFRTWWTTTLWDRFDGQWIRYSYTDPNQPPLQTTGAHCGNAHFPPNADHQYEYSSSDVVSSNCTTWRSDGTGTYVNLTCTAWGCNETGFLNWWMARMPRPSNNHGPGGTRLKNWWTKLAQ